MPHDPVTARTHEKALRRGSFSSIEELSNARKYFKTTEHPERKLWLKQCTLAKKVFIPHLERERQFINLLKLERKKPDKTRWAKIHPLLQAVASYLHIEESLRDSLSELVCLKIDDVAETIEEPNIDYSTWLQVIQPKQNVKKKASLGKEEPLKEELSHASIMPSKKLTTESEVPALRTAQEGALEKSPVETGPKITTASGINASHTEIKAIHKKKKKKKKKKAEPAYIQETSEIINNQIELTACLWATVTTGQTEKAVAFLKKNSGNLLLSFPHPTLKINLLQAAINLNDTILLKELLAQGCDPNTQGFYTDTNTGQKYLTTALLPALIHGKVACLQLLLEAGANPDVHVIRHTKEGLREHSLCIVAYSESENYTPLARAKALTLLLKHGASTICNQLKVLLRHPNLGWLINLQALAQQPLIPEYIPCTTKVSIGNDTLILIVNPDLLEKAPVYQKLKALKGTFLETPDHEGQFCYLVQSFQFEEAKEFFATHPGLNLSKPCLLFANLTPLIFCIHTNSYEMCTYLCDKGADLNHKMIRKLKDTYYELTPLVYAIALGNTQLVTLLLNKGADPNMPLRQADGLMETPLDSIVYRAQNQEFTHELCSDLIRILLLSGATEVSAKVYIVNLKTKTKEAIDLRKKEDQNRVIQLLIDTTFKSIICANETITLLEK